MKLHLRKQSIFPCFNCLNISSFFMIFLLFYALKKMSQLLKQLINHFHFLWGYFHYQTNVCSWSKFWKYMKVKRIKKVISDLLLFSFPSIFSVKIYTNMYLLSYSTYKILYANLKFICMIIKWTSDHCIKSRDYTVLLGENENK